MRARLSAVLVVMFGSPVLMCGLLVWSLWLTFHGEASRVTDVLNVLGYGGIPFVVGVLVSWQWQDIPRGIVTTVVIGLMGTVWASTWALSFAQSTEDDFGSMCMEIGVLAPIPYLLLGSLAGLCGLGIARLLGSSTGQHTAHEPE
jgi:hypothetical protein